MQVLSRDTRNAVEYVSRFTGEITLDVASDGSGLAAIFTMMMNLKRNEHVDPTYVRVAVLDEQTENYLIIGCELCGGCTGIKALTLRPAADRHGNEYYACGGCRARTGLTEVK